MVPLEVQAARRLPDPTIRGAEKHLFTVRCEQLPELPLDANPRGGQGTNKRVYRDVAASLMNQLGKPNAFFAKNQGITAAASQVKKLSDNAYEISFAQGEGIQNGGHTFRIIRDHQDEIRQLNEDGVRIEQFVELEVRVGYPSDLVVECAGTLNTGIQVQDHSLADLSHQFDWIKEAIAGQLYETAIAFRENEPGEYDVRDIISLLDLFNTNRYPNEQGRHPVQAYSFKASVLDRYLDAERQQSDEFRRLAHVLRDILVLHDTISHDAPIIWNKSGGRKAGALAFVDYRANPKKPFDFPFTGKTGQHRLNRGALYPMLGAFRWMIDDANPVGWKGKFKSVFALWEKLAYDLMMKTKMTSEQVDYNTLQIGKSAMHWDSLHSTVAKHQLMGL
jgi:AIPR protein